MKEMQNDPLGKSTKGENFCVENRDHAALMPMQTFGVLLYILSQNTICGFATLFYN